MDKPGSAARASRGARVARAATKSAPVVRAPRANASASATPAEIRVLRHLRELYRVSQQHFQRIEARCGLSGAQLWALSELKARPASTISELAAALSVHLSTASNLLDRLEARQLVRRHRGPPDQRIVRVTLTKEGEALLRIAPKPADGIIQDALHRMHHDALKRLDSDLAALLQHARTRSRAATMKHLAEP